MASIRGVIFDVDGTLIDSNDAHARAWVDALEEFGHKVQFEEVRRRIGMGGDKLLPEVTGISKDSPEGEKINARCSEIFMEQLLPGLRAFAGTKELLEELHRRGLKIVIASSAQKEKLRELLKLTGAHGVIESATSSSDAEKSKPDPDIVEAALHKLGLPPGEVVMIGDTPYDVEAAARAGLRTIGFRSGGWTDSGLTGAIAIYDGPADLLAQLDASPLAEGAGGASAAPQAETTPQQRYV
ncbi:HAD family hydrolase [Sorangium cellulosum]|uniref:Hydrolase n=1 Tax=Sorangium cellulosum TaxID=56 RepID=A0A150QUJ0_SORCE|nr:HAD family hydrolase [Sorangium cellulosum]KYF71630.1 hydrolase [Sorangium cellulosum]